MMIRQLDERDDFSFLTQLLHRGYAVHRIAGRRFLATWQDEAKTRERCARGATYIAELNGRIIGMGTLLHAEYAKGIPALDQPDATGIEQFTVEPEFQRRGIGSTLLAHLEHAAAQRGMRKIVLDTAETATELIDWYKRRGYQPVGYVDWQITNYRSIVFAKSLAPHRALRQPNDQRTNEK